MHSKGTLYILCGKMAAGKSTLANQLKEQHSATLFSEDRWLADLYPGLINNLSDYVTHSARLKPLLHTPIVHLLRAGASVVMDFPANTRQQREWFKEIVTHSEASHKLLYLNASDERCLQQLAIRRNKQPQRRQFDTPEIFFKLARHFEEPAVDEGFTVERVYDRISPH